MRCARHLNFVSGGPLFYVRAAREEAKTGLVHVLDPLFCNIEINAFL